MYQPLTGWEARYFAFKELVNNKEDCIVLLKQLRDHFPDAFAALKQKLDNCWDALVAAEQAEMGLPIAELPEGELEPEPPAEEPSE